ncbi:membrane protein insertase YidC [Streptomyces sp. NPDC089919]|uniref:YidC/Oxa1 family membrane protein insertase n=1 Tax=Streptomyces sp. NPDC089919 TaxID=3155188 RepID=UPI0034242CF0
MSVFASLVDSLARLLDPFFASAATAAAIVVFTMGVRAALHPLTRAAFRGERARAELAPRVAALRKRYAAPKDAQRLRTELGALYAEAKVSPFAGVLPMLVQLPVFFVMYRVFSATGATGTAGELLAHRLGAAPLGARWTDALGAGGPFGAQGLVFLGLFAAIAAVAAWTARRGRRAYVEGTPVGGPGAEELPGGRAAQRIAGWLPLLAFGTLVTAAVVPLAAGLYLLTTTTWTAAERAWLTRRWNARREVAGAAVGRAGGRSGR